MHNIIVREAMLDDIVEVAKVHVDSWYETYASVISQDYLDAMKTNLAKRTERMKKEFHLRTMIVATINDEIVGFSELAFSNVFSEDLDIDCELCGLYVKNGYKNLGVGSKLFTHGVNLFKEKHMKKMGLWCIKDNTAALCFYEKKGGIPAKEKTVTIGNQEYPVVSYTYLL